jgi:hypothetical protein
VIFHAHFGNQTVRQHPTPLVLPVSSIFSLLEVKISGELENQDPSWHIKILILNISRACGIVTNHCRTSSHGVHVIMTTENPGSSQIRRRRIGPD